MADFVPMPEAPLKTQTEGTPQWFRDYVQAVNEWAKRVQQSSLQLQSKIKALEARVAELEES